MSHFWLIEVLRYRKLFLFGSGLMVAILVVLLLFLLNPKFQVQMDFLVSQEDVSSKDYYTLARSSEYIGKILSEVSRSERFIDALVETGKVNSEFLPFDKKQRVNTWQSMMKMTEQSDLGILHVIVQSDDQRMAQRVAQAVAQVMIEKNGVLLGAGDKNIPMSILSGPTIENNPSTKEIMLAAVSGFVFGVLLAIFQIFFKQEVFRD